MLPVIKSFISIYYIKDICYINIQYINIYFINGRSENFLAYTNLLPALSSSFPKEKKKNKKL